MVYKSNMVKLDLFNLLNTMVNDFTTTVLTFPTEQNMKIYSDICKLRLIAYNIILTCA